MIKFIVASLGILIASVVGVSASAMSHYPTKAEYEDFVSYVDDFVTNNYENEYYNQAIDTFTYISYSSYINIPSGPNNYTTQFVEIIIENVSVDLEYELVGVDQPINIHPTVYGDVAFWLTDALGERHYYTTELVFNFEESFETPITPSMFVRDGLGSEITPFTVDTAMSISLQTRVISYTDGVPTISCYFAFADTNVELYSDVDVVNLLSEAINPIFGNFRYLGLPCSSNGLGIKQGIILLTNNTVETIPNYFYTYLVAQDYGGVTVLNPLGDIDFTSWLMNAIGGFMDAEFLPGLSLSSILLFIISLGLMIIVLRYFAGG